MGEMEHQEKMDFQVDQEPKETVELKETGVSQELQVRQEKTATADVTVVWDKRENLEYQAVDMGVKRVDVVSQELLDHQAHQEPLEVHMDALARLKSQICSDKLMHLKEQELEVLLLEGLRKEICSYVRRQEEL